MFGYAFLSDANSRYTLIPSRKTERRFNDPLDRIRGEKLIELARKRFDFELVDAELKILSDSASSTAPPIPEESDLKPDVRPEFIRWLATDPEASPYIDPRGAIVQGVTISGTVDLMRCRIPIALSFLRCEFRGELKLQHAEVAGLSLWGSSLNKGLGADWVTVHGSVDLEEVRSAARIGLALARIEGELDCSGAKFIGEDASLSASVAEIRGGVRLNDFECSGAVSLNGARVGNALDLSGAKLRWTEVALRAHLIDVGGGIYLRDMESSGSIDLSGAQIRDFLDCCRAKLTTKGEALVARGALVGSAVDLSNLQSSGSVDLRGARIDSYLNCTGAKLKVSSGDALLASHIAIGASAGLCDGFESTGTIRMDGAKIQGDLNCNGAKLTVQEDHLALSADMAMINGSVFLTNEFECLQPIRLVNATVKGSLSCMGARLGSVKCDDMRISTNLVWLGVRISKLTELNLSGAKVSHFRDDSNSWPMQGGLIIDGFEYDELTLHEIPTSRQIESNCYSRALPLKTEERLRWIKLQMKSRSLEPQPWLQLSKVFEMKGDRAGAKQVLAEFRRVKARELEWHPYEDLRRMFTHWFANGALYRYLRGAIRDLRHPNRALAVMFAWLEEMPMRILYSIAVSLIIGGLIFSHAGGLGALAPTESQAYEAFTKGRPMPAAYPALNPLVYTLENALPLVKLGQDDKWAPDRRHAPNGWATNYWLLMWVRWGLILFGWFQATVLAAAMVNRFKP